MFAKTVSVLASAVCKSVCVLHRCLNRRSSLCSVGSLKVFPIYTEKPFNLHLRRDVMQLGLFSSISTIWQ